MLTKISNLLTGALCFFSLHPSKSKHVPSLDTHRFRNQDTAVVFVHGFNGNAGTWAGFIDLLKAEQKVIPWDIFGVNFPSSLRIDIPNLWSADPSIDTLAIELVTTLSLSPLNRYKRIALVAHSMGGLVVQRAILDNDALAARLSHVLLFGTPSAGLNKATFGKWLKRQFRDMSNDSVFIEHLRAGWTSKFGDSPPFEFMVLQGDRDEFVSGPSSLSPFPKKFQRVVPGNHLEMVRPTDRDHPGFQLVIQDLGGKRAKMAAVDGARLAVELGEFQEAVNTLLPRVTQIDEAAMVTLALALDGLTRSDEALELLEAHCKKSSAEALGVLGGRIKRRWLAQRSAFDLARARSLYASGLDIALQDGDYSQAYYHAINIAFLDLISAPANSRLPDSVSIMARKALEYCAHAEQDKWCWATQGEAYLMLGDHVQAESFYRKAINETHSPRERQSMYSQALRVALCAGGADIGRAIEQIFGVVDPPAGDV